MQLTVRQYSAAVNLIVKDVSPEDQAAVGRSRMIVVEVQRYSVTQSTDQRVHRNIIDFKATNFIPIRHKQQQMSFVC
jgi:hypothetical protein